MEERGLTEVILLILGFLELICEKEEVLLSGADETDGFEVCHDLPVAGIKQIKQVNLLLQDFVLREHCTDDSHLLPGQNIAQVPSLSLAPSHDPTAAPSCRGRSPPSAAHNSALP